MSNSSDSPFNLPESRSKPSKSQRRLSISSRRSEKSVSQPIRRSRSTSKRPRGLSMASMHSQAVTDTWDTMSRKTVDADDGDASDSNEEYENTSQDVWFKTECPGSEEVKIDELDQLLNLQDDKDEAMIAAKPWRPNSQLGNGRLVSADQVNSGQANLDQTISGREKSGQASSGQGSAIELETFRMHQSPEMPTGNDFPVLDDMLNSPQLSSADPASSKSSDEMEKEKLSTVERVHTVDQSEPLPQRFSFFATNLDSTIHAPDLASLVKESGSFANLLNPKNGAWFLDCFRPTDLEMRALSRAFGIHPLTAEDIRTEDSREKFERFRTYNLIVYHTFRNDPEDAKNMEPVNFYILVFKEGVITFHFEPVSHCRNVRRRMRQVREFMQFNPDWISYALIDDITDHFAPEIAAVQKEADFVEDAVYLDPTAEVQMHPLLYRLGIARRRTMVLLHMMSGKAEVVRGFAKRCTEERKNHGERASEMGLYLDDIQDHLATMYQSLSVYEKIFGRTHFNYMGLLQMEFVDASNRMTRVLGKVTVLGSVLLPMNIITGLFGMNVKVPGQDVENLNWWFSILGVIIFFALLLIGAGFFYVRTSQRGLVTHR